MYFSLLENEYKLDNVFFVQINPNLISVLKQTRSLMSQEGLSELIYSIKKNGQKTPGDIFAFQKKEAIDYLKNLNDLWNTKYDIKQFEECRILEKSNFYYLFLVAGHRRLKACIETKQKYLAKIHFQKSFNEAIQWQLEENLHEELPLLDLIISATNLWLIQKSKNNKLTLKDFAKKHIFKSVTWLSNALRFARLPFAVQELIQKTETSKGVNYSILLEFAKLYDFSINHKKPLKEKILIAYINHCLAEKYKLQKVKEFCKIRQEEIAGQQTLFQLETEEVNNNSLIAIRRNKTLHMTEAESYLRVSGVIVKQITKVAKNKARNVIELGKQLKL